MAVPTELFDYLRLSDGGARAHVQTASQLPGVTQVDIRLTSQVWQGITWTHRLQLFVPKVIPNPGTALIYVLDSRPDMDSDLGCLFALESGVPCALLYDIPNQPLFDDLVEDALIARTFVNYLDTGDPSWPLLFPMVKSVVRAMDAIQKIDNECGFHADRFVVTGASKRGWTTWLSAATDPRVSAIIPMVYDNLNIPAQLPHQIEAAGAYSDEISDYTAAGLPERLGTPEGKLLTRMIDPYTYRNALTLPKLIINGANDRYWMTDALNLYWDDLSGQKHVLYIPNSGHSLNDYERLFGAMRTFLRLHAEGRDLPWIAWSFTSIDGEIDVQVDIEEDTTAARCWMASASGHDFRDSTWTSTAMKLTHGSRSTRHWQAAIPIPKEGHRAIFAEVDLDNDGQPYRLSTQIHITE